MTTTLEVRAWDNWGNKVQDGTSLEVTLLGDAQFEQEVRFLDGRATVRVTGGMEPENVTLKLRADNAYSQKVVPIHNLTITTNVSQTFTAGQLEYVRVTVTDSDGNPVGSQQVELGVTHGRLQTNVVTTNAEGEAITWLHPGYSEGEGKLIAAINFSVTETVYSVKQDTIEQTVVSAQKAVVMGTHDAPGSATATAYDGTELALPYETATPIQLKGSPGEKVTARLGTLYDPAIEPLLEYPMQRLYGFETTESVHQHTAAIQNLSTGQTHPKGIGTSAYFTAGSGDDPLQESVMVVPPFDAIKRPNDIGFRLAIRPEQLAGTLVKQADGAQILEILPSGQLRYRIRTATQNFEVVSEAVALEQWHRIVARYTNGQLELEVNGTSYITNAVGDISYGSSDIGLEVGKGYVGYLSGLRVYNWQAPKLLAFDNGTLEQEFTIGEAGAITAFVHSTGQLGKTYQESHLDGVAVALDVKGHIRHISLLSESAYTRLAVMYLETAMPDSAVTAYAAPAATPLDLLIPPAQAGILSDIWDSMKGVVEFIVPFEAIGSVTEQVKYLISGDQRFDPFKLTMASLEVVTILPVAKPLLPVLKVGGKMGGPLLKFVNKLRGTDKLKYFADFLGQGARQVVDSRRFDKFVTLLPFMVLVGEMLAETGSDEALAFIADTINSSADLEGWIAYLYLEFDEELQAENYAVLMPPALPPSAIAVAAGRVLEQLIPPAEANWKTLLQRLLTTGRLTGATLLALLRNTKDILKRSGLLDEFGEQIGPVVHRLARIMRDKNNYRISALRKYLFDKRFLVAAVAVGARAGLNHLEGMLKGLRNGRIGPEVMIASVAYLESRWKVIGGNDYNEDLTKSIKQLYVAAFVDATLYSSANNTKGKKNSCDLTVDVEEEDKGNETTEQLEKKKISWPFMKAVGATFHLTQVAALDILHQTGVGSIKEIEATRKVNVVEGVTTHAYDRRVDIVLSGAGDDSATDKWVELKSYARNYKNAPDAYKKSSHMFQKKWASLGSKGTTSVRQQFYLDRIHAGTDDFINRMQWRFHKFNKCSNEGLGEPILKAYVRPVVFKPTPKAVLSKSIRMPTFGVDALGLVNYQTNFNGGLDKIVIPVGTTIVDVLREKAKEYVPTPRDVTDENIDAFLDGLESEF